MVLPVKLREYNGIISLDVLIVGTLLASDQLSENLILYRVTHKRN